MYGKRNPADQVIGRIAMSAARLTKSPRIFRRARGRFFTTRLAFVPSETGTPEAPSQVGDSRQVPERSATAAVLQQIILEKCDV
jgi:hypothetical protein